MSEWSKWDEIVWGFTKITYKQMLKVSAFYLEKQKSFIPKKYFPEGFDFYHLFWLSFCSIEIAHGKAHV